MCIWLLNCKIDNGSLNYFLNIFNPNMTLWTNTVVIEANKTGLKYCVKDKKKSSGVVFWTCFYLAMWNIKCWGKEQCQNICRYVFLAKSSASRFGFFFLQILQICCWMNKKINIFELFWKIQVLIYCITYALLYNC